MKKMALTIATAAAVTATVVGPEALAAFQLEYEEGVEHGKGIVGDYHVPRHIEEQFEFSRPRLRDTGKWDPILACESGGNWNETAGTFEGGLQFHPQTWDAYKSEGDPDSAYQASPSRQIAVAERVLQAQGWGAWPVCSRKAGYR